MRKLLLLFLLLFVPFSLEAKTLYVDGATGSDATTYANNDATHKWATIGRAAWGSTNPLAPVTAQAAQAGDTVLITAGTYTSISYVPDASYDGDTKWTPAFKPVNTGTAIAPITFRGVGVVDLRMATGYLGPIIGCRNQSYITWDNFYIDEVNIHDVSDTGPVVASASSYCIFQNLEIKGKAATYNDNHNAIRIENADYTEVRNCKIYDIEGISGFGENSTAVMFYDSNYSLIENNEFYHCGTGVFIKGRHMDTQIGTVVRKNLIYNMGAYGVAIAGSDGASVYQNILRDNNQSLDMWGFSNGHHTNNKFVNNTVVRATSAMGHIRPRADGEGSYNFFVGSVINNNIFMSTTYGNIMTDTKWGAVATNITHEHNNYYDFTASKFWYSEGAASKTFAQWKSDFGKDDLAPDSITTDPLFVNASTNDFHLQAGSPALTLGVDILDLDGDGSTTDTVPAGAYITGSEVIGLDVGDDETAPTITNVSSNKANGNYTVGEVIDIDLTFSESVTSTGNVTVELETGTTDRTCTFTVTNAMSGTCNYTVQAGDTSGDLTVKSISGTIADQSSNAMTSFTPVTNLAANKALVIDTTVPVVTAFTVPATGNQLLVFTSTFTCTDTGGTGVTGYTMNESATPPAVGAAGWTLTLPLSYTFATEGAKTLYGYCKDAAGNVSAGTSDTITITLTTGGIIKAPWLIVN